MPYKCKPKPQNEIETIIADACLKAKSNDQIKTIVHANKGYQFERIRMNRDDLYYNLENDRTLTAVEEFIVERDLDTAYFDRENFTLIPAQQDYHSIISKFIPGSMTRILKDTKDQRDPVYITRQGIMANGNTRLACFRNLGSDCYENIDCLVFPEELTDNWDFIRRFVDLADNAEDFSSSYPWHARAKRIQKNIDAGDLTDPDYKTIAAKMQYKDAKEAKTHHQMLSLANEFIAVDRYEKFKKLSDLEQRGDDHGLQVFNTLGVAHQKDIPQEVKLKLKNVSFEIIANDEKGSFDSRHRALQALWAKSNVEKEIAKMRAITIKPTNRLGGEKPAAKEDKKTDGKVYEVNPFKGQTDDDTKKITSTILEEAAINKETEAAKNKQDVFASGLEKVYRNLKSITELSLNDSSNLNGIEIILSKLSSQLEKTTTRIQVIKKSHEQS